MQGLLSLLDSPGAQLGLGLLAAAGPQPVPMSFGQRAAGALGAFQADQRARKQEEAQAAIRELQMQMMKAQMLEKQREAERQKTDGGILRNLAQGIPADGMGPPTGKASLDPQAFLGAGGSLEGLDPLMRLNAALNPAPRPRKTVTVGNALIEVPEAGPVSTLYEAPKDAPKPPTSVQEYEFAKSQGFKGTFEQWKKDNARAGATSISLNTGDRIPPGQVKFQDEIIDKLTVARATDADLGAIEQQIQSGQLSFGPVRNLVNEGRNLAGSSTEESRRFASFRSSLEKLRNDSLRLNNGVQTEGDAQRAWNELFRSINDTQLVKERLAEIRKINQRAAQLQQYRLQVLRENFGAGPLQPPQIDPVLPTPAAPSLQDLLNKYGN